jgi:anti-anti-sigma factor
VTSVDGGALNIEEAAEGEARIFRLNGDLDMATAPMLDDRLHRAMEGGDTRFVVDVAGVTFMDSTGISVLLHSLKDVQRLGGGLVLRSPTARTLRVLEIIGLRELFGL